MLARGGQDFPIQLETGLLPLVLGMETDGVVFSIEHPNHDSEEGGDDRHGLTLHLQARVGLTAQFSCEARLNDAEGAWDSHLHSSRASSATACSTAASNSLLSAGV
jgi:hypothetical protein